MNKTLIKREQIELLHRLMEEGMKDKQMYPLLGMKWSAVTIWKSRLKELGLDGCIKRYL